MKKLIVSYLLALSSCGSAFGIILVTVEESSGDVVFSSSGTANLTDLTLLSGDWGSAAGMRATHNGGITFRLSDSGDSLPWMHMYEGALAPEELFTTLPSFHQPDVHSGVMLGVLDTRILVSEDYVSGSEISASMIYFNESFDSLQLIPGDYTWTWGSGENSDSLTVSVIPEPSSYAFMFGLLLYFIVISGRKGMLTSRCRQLRDPSGSLGV
ncbi:MAG: hypothetical protein AAGF10_01985 [Verrucomicrobiota bacterium]